MKFFALLGFVTLLVGCNATQQIKPYQLKDVSILIDSTILVSDTTQQDAVHFPINQQLSQTMFDVVSTSLLQRGYKVCDHALTVAATHPQLRYSKTPSHATATPVISASAHINYLSVGHTIHYLLNMHSASARRDIIARLGIKGQASLLVTTHGQVTGGDSRQVLKEVDVEQGFIQRANYSNDYSHSNSQVQHNYRTSLTLIDNTSGNVIWQLSSQADANQHIDQLINMTRHNLDKQLAIAF